MAKTKKPKKRRKLTPEERFEKMRLNFVVGSLRRRSLFWPPILNAVRAAYVGQRVSKISGRLAKHYKCAKCLNEFPMSRIERDHIIPIGKKSTSWRWINRLLCEPENIQILCVDCHAKKTAEERK